MVSGTGAGRGLLGNAYSRSVIDIVRFEIAVVIPIEDIVSALVKPIVRNRIDGIQCAVGTEAFEFARNFGANYLLCQSIGVCTEERLGFNNLFYIETKQKNKYQVYKKQYKSF